jgi:cobalt/nickel transport system permease protein
VINTLAQVDYLACAGGTVWHRASAVVKLGAAMLLVGAAVFVPGWPALSVLLVTAIVLVLTARLPLRLLLAAATTPIVFALVIVVASWNGEPSRAATLIARPVVAGIVALWLVGTTPYPDLFAPLSRVLPRAVGDGLFLTYRAVFTLLARIERLWKALFLRGALQGPLRRRAGMMGEAVGTVVLYGFERSHRLYQVMHLRGHSGRICGCRHWLELRREDAWVIGTLVVALAASVVLTGIFWA